MMNRLTFLLVFTALTVCAGNLAWAQEDPAWNVRIELQIVTLPEIAAMPLIKELLEEKQNAADKIQPMLEEGKATLVEWSTIIAGSGQRIGINLKSEAYFVSEFNRFYMASDPGSAETANGASAIEITKFDRLPSKIESRETGLDFEATATVLKNGELLDVFLTLNRVQKQEAAKEPDQSSGIKEPAFAVTETRPSIYLKNKQRVLAGIHKIPGAQIQLELLKVEAIKID